MSKKNSDRPSIFDESMLEATQPTETVETVEKPAKRLKAKVEVKTTPAKGEAELFRTSVYLSPAVHDRLRELAFTERKKVNELLMEGLDKLLVSRGYPTTAETKAAR